MELVKKVGCTLSFHCNLAFSSRLWYLRVVVGKCRSGSGAYGCVASFQAVLFLHCACFASRNSGPGQCSVVQDKKTGEKFAARTLRWQQVEQSSSDLTSDLKHGVYEVKKITNAFNDLVPS